MSKNEERVDDDDDDDDDDESVTNQLRVCACVCAEVLSAKSDACCGWDRKCNSCVCCCSRVKRVSRA